MSNGDRAGIVEYRHEAIVQVAIPYHAVFHWSDANALLPPSVLFVEGLDCVQSLLIFHVLQELLD